MKLTSKERRVLAAAQFRADSPLHEIAAACGCREHTVRNALSSLKGRGIIVKRSMVNVRLLGLTRFALFFSLARESRKFKSALFKRLMENERIGWIREFGGDYPYVFDVIAPSIDEVWFTVLDISNRFGDVFFEKSLAIRLAVLYFERGYLCPEIAATDPLEELPLRTGTPLVQIDEIDHRILSSLGQGPDLNDTQLARLLGVPRTSVQHRLRQLRAKGVLLRSFYDLNPILAGIFAYRLLIRARGTVAEGGARLRSYLQAHPRVVSLIMCMGAWDFETTIEVEDQRDATSIVTELYESFGETIAEIKLLPVFDEPKDIMYPLKTFSPIRSTR